MRTNRRAYSPALVVSVATLLAVAGTFGSDVVWDFETAQTGWRALEPGVVVERERDGGAPPGSAGALHIHGRSETGWNYARSEDHPLESGRCYRLSAMLKVDKLGQGASRPFLKCEFETPAGDKEVGRVLTNPYEMLFSGEWQRLIVDFQAPDGVTRCWVSLVKGTDGVAELDALLDDVHIAPIPRVDPFFPYRLESLPASLTSKRGIHPRLYLDSATAARKPCARLVESLRTATAASHKGLWLGLKAQADKLAAAGPSAYADHAGEKDEEQLWQRPVGNAMPVLAMAWLLSGDRKYLDAAQAWALAACGYDTWGLGRFEGVDLAAGHQLFGLALVYDWCHKDLDEETRRTIRGTLETRGAVLGRAAANREAWWHDAYLQNHLWVNTCGLAAAGLALFDESDEAADWIGFALAKFRAVMVALGPDGATHEGVGYWGYGLEYLMKFLYLARDLLDVDLYDAEWLHKTAAYRLYLSVPREAWTKESTCVDIADCPRYDWYGPDYTLRGLASEFRDPHAQWLADEIDNAGMESPVASWLSLLWFNPAIEATPPESLSPVRHFDDMGIVSSRSSWRGDESLLVFKCGPFIGHHAVQRFAHDPGGGHVHPDAGHFVLFGNGEWLLRDDGYQDKWTGQHNTFLIDDLGQMGEGNYPFQGNQPLALKAEPTTSVPLSTAGLDHIAGDATAAYPPNLGLRRFVRHLLFLKPDVLIVLDDIQVDRPRMLELRFHPEQTNVEVEGAAYLSRGEKAVLRTELLTPDDVAVEARTVSGSMALGRGLRMFTIRLTSRRSEWRNAVAFSWASAKPAQVALTKDGAIWRFNAGTRTVVFDWGAATAHVEPPA